MFHFIDYGTVWTGWWDEPNEGEIVPIPLSQSSSKLPFAPWHFGQPNGDKFENCVTQAKDGQWYDNSCSFKMCAACQIQSAPTFVMRGKPNHNDFVIFALLYLICMID